LLATGKVKLTYVDVPFSKATPTYAKYYLYAANADSGMDNILHVRNLFFEAAQVKHIQKEDALVAYLKEKNITWKAMDEKSIFPVMSAIIKENKVDSTPTCVIKYSAKDVKKYIDDDEIWVGLTKLKAHLVNVKE
jgi:thiol:disulfide interchange protein DsbA